MTTQNLKQIVETLKADEFAKSEEWAEAARLVHDGIRELNKLTQEQINQDQELKDARRYLFTEQVPLYVSGKRSNVYTRRYIMIALAEKK